MATRIRIKRGTESQITGYTGTHYEGELAYATNTGNVFVNDGTAFINIGGGGGATPTLQSVTDEGNTTTNSISAGTITANNELHLVNSAMRIFRSGNDMRLRTNNSDRITITSNGNVGIGTTAPAAKLDVNGSIYPTTHNAGTLGLLQLKEWSYVATRRITGENNRMELLLNGNVVVLKDHNTIGEGIQIKNRNNVVAQFGDATGSGNVGIGTTAPAHVLHINKDNPYIQIQDSSAPTRADMSAGIIMKDSTGAQSFGITQSNSVDVSIRANAGDLSLGTFAGTVIKLDGNNVGIGTTAPAAKLDVRGTISQRVDASVSANQYPLQFFNDYSGTDYYLLRQRVVNSGAQVRTGLGITGAPDAAFVLGPQTDQTIKFSTNGRISNLTDIIAADPLRINSGEVRIGDISGSAASYLNVIQGASSTKPALGLKQGVGGSNKMITILNSSGAETMGITSEGGFYFRDNNLVGRFTFEHDYSPAAADGLTVGIDLRTEDASGNLRSLGYIDVTQDDISADESSMRLSVGETTPTEVMRLQSDGNVGIGTTAPSEKLEVAGGNILLDTNTWIGSGGGSGQPRLRFDNTNSLGKLQQADLVLNDEKSIAWSNTGTSIQGRGVDSQRIEFNVASSERMRITSDGNVGIGTTAPDSKLHIKATSGIAFKVDPNNADKEWYIDTTNPDHLKKEGNLILNADPTNVHASTKISFNIDGSNKASINSDGDLGVGTTAQTSKVHVDGTAMRQLRMGTSGGPSSNTDTSGAIGDMAYDDNYFYIKTINGWGRVPLDFGF